jgi:hypothetical protein
VWLSRTEAPATSFSRESPAKARLALPAAGGAKQAASMSEVRSPQYPSPPMPRVWLPALSQSAALAKRPGLNCTPRLRKVASGQPSSVT